MESAHLIAGQQQLQGPDLTVQVGYIAFEHVFQPHMSDLSLEAWRVARFSQLAVDDGDEDGTSFEGIGEGGIELPGGLGVGMDFQAPCCNVLEGVSDGGKLDGGELDVEGNTAVAVSDLVQLLGELADAGNDGQHTADAADDFHPMLIGVKQGLARGSFGYRSECSAVDCKSRPRGGETSKPPRYSFSVSVLSALPA